MRLSEIQQALRDESLDGWLFFDHHERDPLAYRVLQFAAPRTPTRRWYYLIPAHGEPRRLVHAIEAGMLDALPGSKAKYSSWGTQSGELKNLLAGCKKIAMQYSPLCAIPYVAMVDAGTIELVRSCGVEIVSSANLIQIFEARWTADQLETHREAGRRVDAVLREAFRFAGDALRSGGPVTEYCVQQFIRKGFADAGLVTDHGPIVAVNANASNPHYEPTAACSAAIQHGDLLLIDLWAKLDKPDSVYYDITWTGYCGASVPPEMQKVFAVVSGARDKAVQRVQSAVAAGEMLHGYDVDDAARNHIREQGYGDYFIHRTGHSIGTEVHGTGANMDNLETHDERRIIPMTCFSVEPGVYLPEWGIRSEVNVFVKEHEAIVTGEIQRGLVLV